MPHDQPPLGGPLTARVSRRRFLVVAAAAGASVAFADALHSGWFRALEVKPDRLRWVSPRGSLVSMDDYHLWVAKRLGYFERLGLEVDLLAGTHDANATTNMVASGEADIGCPSPDAMATAADRQLPLVSIFQLYPGQVYSLAVPPASKIRRPADLAGRRIAIGSPSWRRIVDPILIDAGVEVRSIRYVDGGPVWGELAARGHADAALVWEGLRAAWTAAGKRFRYLAGERWSRLPSNVYAVRSDELTLPSGRDRWQRFLTAVVMGLEFARENPRAAAQITYRSIPGLADSISPQQALDSMLQVARGYGDAGSGTGGLWGTHDPERWRRFVEASTALGYIKPIEPRTLYTNALLTESNPVDLQRVRADALSYPLDRDYARTTISAGAGTQ